MACKKICNVIKSYNLSRDRSNLIETILYLLKIDFSLVTCYLTYLTFSINFSNQSFESNYAINLLIESMVSLACGI